MTKRRILTPDDDETIRRLFLARHSDNEIAGVLGVTRLTVFRHRRAMGITPSDRPSARESMA